MVLFCVLGIGRMKRKCQIKDVKIKVASGCVKKKKKSLIMWWFSCFCIRLRVPLNGETASFGCLIPKDQVLALKCTEEGGGGCADDQLLSFIAETPKKEMRQRKQPFGVDARETFYWYWPFHNVLKRLLCCISLTVNKIIKTIYGGCTFYLAEFSPKIILCLTLIECVGMWTFDALMQVICVFLGVCIWVPLTYRITLCWTCRFTYIHVPQRCYNDWSAASEMCLWQLQRMTDTRSWLAIIYADSDTHWVALFTPLFPPVSPDLIPAPVPRQYGCT